MSSHSSRVMSPDGGGPSTPPPTVPEGWLAQWESRTQRWYYVQRATGRSQWEVPTEPFIPTPTSTPQSVASPGPYYPPGTSDAEATRELREVRSGGTWRSSGGSYPNIAFDSNQASPQARQANRQSQSPAVQTTPVAAGSGQPSRSSSQATFGAQTASEFVTRSGSSEMAGMQQTTPQNLHGYPNPTPPTTSGAEYISRSPQQPMGQGQAYGNPDDSMQVDDPRMMPQAQAVMYHGQDNVAAAQHIPHTSAGPNQSPPIDPTGSGMAPGHMGTAVPANPGAQYQQFGGPMPPHAPQGPPPSHEEAGITVIPSDPNRRIFPTPYEEAQRQRERQQQQQQQASASQPQRDPRYQYASERQPPAGYDPRAAPGYYDRGPPPHDPRYQQQPPPQPGGGYNPNQGRYDYESYQDPRYEYRGGEYPPYNGHPSPDQQGRYAMPRQSSQGSVPQQQYDYGRGGPSPAGVPGYAAAHDQRYPGGGYPQGRSR